MKRAAIAALALAFGPAAPAQAARVQTAREGQLRASYTFPAMSGEPVYGRLRIWNGGRLIVNRRIYTFYRGRGRVLSIRQLDGVGPPEVLLSLDSGGAPCCSSSSIYSGQHRTEMTWGHFGLPKLRDADGDGRPEFHGLDTSFGSVFDGSRSPAKVWQYAHQRVQDVTGSYPAEVQADQAGHYAAYLTAREQRNGIGVGSALAAYAADGYSLGRGEETMAVVQAAVDAGEVDLGGTVWEPSYLALLRDVLRDRGYLK